MKWIYRILRLFFFPHKFIFIENIDYVNLDTSTIIIGRSKINRCKYCGKYKSFKCGRGNNE